MTALAGEPLPVEFAHDGTWYPGVLLGWRHEADGSCSARVRFVVGGLKRSSWLPLADLRLAEPTGPAPYARGASVEPTAAPSVAVPRTRPDLLLPDRDWSRPLPAPDVPHPRRHTDDLSWV